MKRILVYTDGSCRPDIKVGGWAFVIIEEEGKIIYEISNGGGSFNTTNNRMELRAIIETLKFFESRKKKDFEIIIHTDSLLSMNCAMGKWKRKKNLDMWVEYDRVKKVSHSFVKVKAHSGIEYNEMVDLLAKKEMWKKI